MKIFKKWWFWLIVLIIVIGIASGGGDTPSQPAQAPQDDNVTKTETSSTAKTNTSDKSATDNQTAVKDPITFTNIIINTSSGFTTVNGEAINNDDKMHSFTLKVSFYDANKKLLGTAIGTVNELAPKDTKIFTAMATEDYSKADSYKVEVDTMVQSEKSYTPPKIEFSNIVIKNQSGFTQVDGEATNKDDKAHSFTLTVGFYDANGKLLGTAMGTVNDIAAGATKTFTAMATGDYSKAANTKVYIDTLVN